MKRQKKTKMKAIEEIESGVYDLVCEVLDDWSDSQFNIASECAREALAEAIVQNIFKSDEEE
jgi:hypothetical protein